MSASDKEPNLFETLDPAQPESEAALSASAETPNYFSQFDPEPVDETVSLEPRPSSGFMQDPSIQSLIQSTAEDLARHRRDDTERSLFSSFIDATANTIKENAPKGLYDYVLKPAGQALDIRENPYVQTYMEVPKAEARGLLNTMGSLAYGVGQYGRTAGTDGIADAAENTAAGLRRIAEGKLLKARVDRIANIKKETWFKDTVDYVASAAGEGVGSSAPFFASAFAGGPVGMAAFGYTTSLGELREELREGGVTDETTIAKYAYLAAFPHAILDQLTERGMLGRLSPAAQKAVRKGILRLVMSTGAKEGATEAAQRVIELGAVAHAMGGDTPNEAMVNAIFADVNKGVESSILESGVRGAIPGGVFGVAEYAQQPAAQATPDPATQQAKPKSVGQALIEAERAGSAAPQAAPIQEARVRLSRPDVEPVPVGDPQPEEVKPKGEQAPAPISRPRINPEGGLGLDRSERSILDEIEKGVDEATARMLSQEVASPGPARQALERAVRILDETGNVSEAAREFRSRVGLPEVVPQDRATLSGQDSVADEDQVEPGSEAGTEAIQAEGPKQSPIVQFRKDAAEIEKTLPPVAEGHTRLWRGNRAGEIGKNPSFTNDLPGIALPFRKAYGGELSYVDVPTADLDKYLDRVGSAPGAEFHLPSELASKAVSAEKPARKEGQSLPDNAQKIVTPDGSMEVDAVPEIVDLSTLKYASGALQPRDRSRAESQIGVRERAANLDPAQLVPSRVSDSGAPVITADGTILSGNGRAMSIAEAYNDPALQAQAAAYRASLGPEAEGMAMPVRVMRLARNLATDDLRRFADLSNRPRAAGLSATERALRDARAGEGLLGLYEGGEFTAPQNREFLRRFMAEAVSQAELPNFSKDGQLTKEGVDRMNAALLGAAYGDPDLLSIMLESTDDNVRSFTNALRDAAGHYVRLKADIAAGIVPAEFDITGEIADTVKLVSGLRQRGISPKTYLAQIDAFSTPSPVTTALLEAFYNEDLSRALSQQKITEVLVGYAEEAAKKRSGGLFEDTTSPQDIIGTARLRGEQPDLLSATDDGGRSGARGAESQGRKAPVSQPQAQDQDGIPKRLKDHILSDASLNREARVNLALEMGLGEKEIEAQFEEAVASGWLKKDNRGIYRRGPKAAEARGLPAPAQKRKPRRSATDVSKAIEAAVAEVGHMLSQGQGITVFEDVADLPEGIQAGARRAIADGGSIEGVSYEGEIFLASYALNMKGRLAHEGFHELVRRGVVREAELRLLAKRAGQIDVGYNRDTYRSAYAGRYDIETLERVLDEEAGAHLLEARVSGKDVGARSNRILDRIIAFLERLANKMRGLGFQTADDVMEEFTSGRMALRPRNVTLPGGVQVTGIPLFAIRGYHGSPHDFNAERKIQWPDGRVEYIVGEPGRLPDVPDGATVVRDYPLGRFREDKALTGEGAQAYGHGVAYIAENEGVARSYRDSLSGIPDSHDVAEPVVFADPASKTSKDTWALGFLRQRPKLPTEDFVTYLNRRATQLQRLGRAIGSNAHLEAAEKIRTWTPTDLLQPEAPKSSGHMYEVNINADPESFLDWDLPIAQQSEKVRATLGQLGLDGEKSVFDALNEAAARRVGKGTTEGDFRRAELEGTNALRGAGIPGIRYKDAMSRGGEGGTNNYVIFDDSIIEIVAKDGVPVDHRPLFAISNRRIDKLGYYSKLDEVLDGFKPTDKVTYQTLQQKGVKVAELEVRGLKEILDKGSASVADLRKAARPVEVREAKYERLSEDDPRIQTARDVRDQTRWSSYSLDPSNPTYQETVLHLPVPEELRRRLDEVNSKIKEIEEAPRTKTNQLSDESGWLKLKSEQDKLTAAIENGKFRSGHFSEPNVIAHIRSAIYENDKGEKVYLLDELQSDWGQKAREGGVRDEAKIAELSGRLKEIDAKANAEIAAVRPDIDAIEEKFGLFPILRDRHYISDAVKAMTTKWAESEDDLRAVLEPSRQRLIAAYDDWMQQKRLVEAELRTAEAATPGHPLINSTDTWVTIGLRRFLRQAAEADVEGVAVTPGSVQNERFNLANQVQSLRYDPRNRALFMKPIGSSGWKNVTTDYVDPSQLKDYVGKEIADQLLASEMVEDQAWSSGIKAHQIDNLTDVEIGGEGMKYAYDVMYPRVLAKELQRLDPSIAIGKTFLAPSDYKMTEAFGDQPNTLSDNYRRYKEYAKGTPYENAFTYFKLTDLAKQRILNEGLPLIGQIDAVKPTPVRDAAEEQIRNHPLFAISYLDHEANRLTKDIRDFEDAQWKAGLNAEEIADAIYDRYGFAIDARDLAMGRVWWKIDGEETDGEDVLDRGLLPFVDEIDHSVPAQKRGTAPVDLDAKPEKPQQASGIEGFSGQPVAIKALDADMLADAKRLKAQGLGANRISEELSKKTGRYVPLTAVVASLEPAPLAPIRKAVRVGKSDKVSQFQWTDEAKAYLASDKARKLTSIEAAEELKAMTGNGKLTAKAVREARARFGYLRDDPAPSLYLQTNGIWSITDGGRVMSLGLRKEQEGEARSMLAAYTAAKIKGEPFARPTLKSAKPPRLYLRKSRGAGPGVWVIKDNTREIATGASADNREAAETALADYIAKKEQTRPTLRPLRGTWHIYRDGRVMDTGVPEPDADGARAALSRYEMAQHPMFAIGDDYRGEHGAPDRESGSPIHDVTLNGIYPKDFYSSDGLRYYGTGNDDLDAAAYRKILGFKDKPDATVAVYRAIPEVAGKRKGLTLGSSYINPGDWVTISRQYAIDHGESALNGKYHLVKRYVRAQDLFTAGDSFLEWGWSPPKSEPMFAIGTSRELVPPRVEGTDSVGRPIYDFRGAEVVHYTDAESAADIASRGYQVVSDGYYGSAVSFTPNREYARQFGGVETVARVSDDAKILRGNVPAEGDIITSVLNDRSLAPSSASARKGQKDWRQRFMELGYDGAYDPGAGDLFIFNTDKVKYQQASATNRGSLSLRGSEPLFAITPKDWLDAYRRSEAAGTQGEGVAGPGGNDGGRAGEGQADPGSEGSPEAQGYLGQSSLWDVRGTIGKFAVRRQSASGLGQREFFYYSQKSQALPSDKTPAKAVKTSSNWFAKAAAVEQPDGSWAVDFIRVRRGQRRRGLASRVINSMARNVDGELKPGGRISQSEYKLWAAVDPDSVRYYQKIGPLWRSPDEIELLRATTEPLLTSTNTKERKAAIKDMEAISAALERIAAEREKDGPRFAIKSTKRGPSATSSDDIEAWFAALEQEQRNAGRQGAETDGGGAAKGRARKSRGQPGAQPSPAVDEGVAGDGGTLGRTNWRDYQGSMAAFDAGIPGQQGFAAEGPRSGTGKRQRFYILGPGKTLPATPEQATAWLSMIERSENAWEVTGVEVNAKARGQKIATRLYAAIERDLGITMRPSGMLTPDGYAYWSKRNPDAVKYHRLHRGMWLSPKQLINLKVINDNRAENSDDLWVIERALEENKRLNAVLATIPEEATSEDVFGPMFAISKAVDDNALANDAEPIPQGSGFGSIPHEARSKHWPHSWGPKDISKWDAETIDRARKFVRREEARERWEPMVNELMWPGGGPMAMHRWEAEAKLLRDRPDLAAVADDWHSANMNFYEHTHPNWQTDRYAAFNIPRYPGTPPPSTDALRDMTIRGVILPDGSTGADHLARLAASDLPDNPLESNTASGPSKAVDQLWGPQFDILMGQQYRIAEAGGDLSTMFDILTAKLSKASGIEPDMRSAMQAKVRELYEAMGPEGRKAAGISEQIPMFAILGKTATADDVAGVPPSGTGTAAASTAANVPPTESLIGISRIVAMLGDAIGMPIRVGRLSPAPGVSVKVSYKDSGVGRIKDVDNIHQAAQASAMHLERVLGDRLSAIKAAHQGEILALAREVGGEDLSVGFGRFFDLYMTSYLGRYAYSKAPKFYDAFEDMMDSHAPQMLADLQATQEAYAQYSKADPSERLKTDIVRPEPDTSYRQDLATRARANIEKLDPSRRSLGFIWEATRILMSDAYRAIVSRNFAGQQLQRLALELHERNTAMEGVSIPDRIRARMKELELTEDQLADKAKLDSAILDGVLSGKKPTQAVAAKIGHALGRSRPWVLTGRDRITIPQGKDLWAYMKSSGNLRAWVENVIQYGFQSQVPGPDGTAVRLGPGYIEVMAAVMNGPAKGFKYDDAMLADFDAFLIARRAAETLYPRYRSGLIPHQPVRESEAAVRKVMADMLAKHPHFADAAAKWDAFNLSWLKRAREVGLITDDQFQTFSEDKAYAPFARDMSDSDVEAARAALSGSTNAASPLTFRLSGSDRNILSPTAVMLSRIQTLVQRSYQQGFADVLESLHDLAGPGIGLVIEKVPAHDVRIQEVNAMDAVRKAVKAAGLEMDDVQTLLDAMADTAGDPDSLQINLVTQRAISPKRGETLIPYRKDGELHFLSIKSPKGQPNLAEDIFSNFAMAGTDGTTIWLDIIRNFAQLRRATITTWPGFIMRNLIQDPIVHWGLFRFVKFPGHTHIKGFKSWMAEDEFYQAYTSQAVGSGIMGGTLAAEARRGLNEQSIRKLVGGRVGYWENLRHFWDKIGQISEASETFGRLGLFKAAAERAMAHGMSPLEAMQEAGAVATDVMNYNEFGALTALPRTAMPFFGAGIVGADKELRTALGYSQRGFAIKTYMERLRQKGDWRAAFESLADSEQEAIKDSGALVLKSIFAFGMIDILLWAMFHDDDTWRDQKDEIHDTHWVIPYEGGLHLINKDWDAPESMKDEAARIPKPFGIAVPGNVIRLSLDAMARDQGGTKAADRIASSVARAFMPPMSLPFIEEYNALSTNRNPMSDRPLTPPHLQMKDPENRYNAYTSYVGKEIGQALLVDPITVDFGIKTVLGPWGRDLLTLTDQLDSDKPAMRFGQTPFGVSRFVTSLGKGSRTLDDYYMMKNPPTQLNVNHLTRLLGGDIQAFEPAKERYKDAAERGRLDVAQSELADMNTEERIYALLNYHWKGGDEVAHKRLHPLIRFDQINAILSDASRDVIENNLVQPRTKKEKQAGIRHKPAEMTAQKRRNVLRLMTHIKNIEAYNALTLMNAEGYTTEPPHEVEPLYRELEAASPEAYKEIQRRLTHGKVLPFEAIEEAWPNVKRVLSDEETQYRISGSESPVVSHYLAGIYGRALGAAMGRRRKSQEPEQISPE